MRPQAVKRDLKEVAKTHAAGNVTEHSYRPDLKTLVESFTQGVTATNEPKRVQCGAPDFIVERKAAPVGHIEFKEIGVSLDDAENTDQLKWYRESLENLILTDYLEFRDCIGGQLQMQVPLARIDRKGKAKLLQGADSQLTGLFNAFLATQVKTIKT